MHERAGQVAEESDLINVETLLSDYYEIIPNPTDPHQQVAFGTSGHRGTSTNGTFNEAHIVSITAAIVEYRKKQGTDGPLFMGADPHALSEPAWRTALEVLTAANVQVHIDSRRSWTPTPAVSLAILEANGAPHNLRQTGPGLADGIIITPSHNPPSDGGFKYNPPSGGPAQSDATTWIANRANELLANGWQDVERTFDPVVAKLPGVHFYDFLGKYVAALETIIDFDVIRTAGVRIGADPMGGAAIDYWGAIAERYGVDLVVMNEALDPTWSFMTLDWDGKIRMDCSSPYAMASVVQQMVTGEMTVTQTPDQDLLEGETPQEPPRIPDVAVGNDADADRHGIVTRDGLMNPNHFLAVAIQYLYENRPDWPAGAQIGKTVVSSSLIDRVAQSLGREVMEVPVGFKYFVAGLLDAHLGFGGEESAGASFLRKDGTVWTTDKDGIVMGLLAAEMLARTGKTPSQLHEEQTGRFGQSWYTRIDQAATREQKAKLAKLSPQNVETSMLAGEPIVSKLVNAPGDNEPIGGLKVTTENSWFAARPSGTEDVYKIYAESFVSEEHLQEVVDAAKEVVDAAIS